MSDDVTVDGSPSVDRGRFPTAVTPWDDEVWRGSAATAMPPKPAPTTTTLGGRPCSGRFS